MMLVNLMLQQLKFKEEARRSAQAHYDWTQMRDQEAAENERRAKEVWEMEYGRDAIDVEAREVPELPLLEKP